MSRQTSMTNDPAVAYEGMLSEAYAPRTISKLVATSTGLSAGRFVKQGTNDDQCDIISATGDVTGLGGLGFTVFDPSKAGNWPLPSTTGIFQQGQAVTIVRRGAIWVITEEAVTPTDAPYVRFASGSFTVIGRVRKSNDSSSAVALPTARFMTSASANGLVLLEINLV